MGHLFEKFQNFINRESIFFLPHSMKIKIKLFERKSNFPPLFTLKNRNIKVRKLLQNILFWIFGGFS
jgi:hypothetical protein